MGNAIFMFVFVCFITGALVHGKEWEERIEELIKEEENKQMKSILLKDTTKAYKSAAEMLCFFDVKTIS